MNYLIASLESKFNRVARSLVALQMKVASGRRMQRTAIDSSDVDPSAPVMPEWMRKEHNKEVEYYKKKNGMSIEQMAEFMLRGSGLVEAVYEVAQHVAAKAKFEKERLKKKIAEGLGDAVEEDMVERIEKQNRSIEKYQNELDELRENYKVMRETLDSLHEEINDKSEDEEVPEEDLRLLKDKASRYESGFSRIRSQMSETEQRINSLKNAKDRLEKQGTTVQTRFDRISKFSDEFNDFVGNKTTAESRIFDVLKENSAIIFGSISASKAPALTDPEDLMHEISLALYNNLRPAFSIELSTKAERAIDREMGYVAEGGKYGFLSVAQFLNWVGMEMHNAAKRAKSIISQEAQAASGYASEDEAATTLDSTEVPDPTENVAVSENDPFHRESVTFDDQLISEVINEIGFDKILNSLREFMEKAGEITFSNNYLARFVWNYVLNREGVDKAVKGIFGISANLVKQVWEAADDPNSPMAQVLTYRRRGKDHNAGDRMDLKVVSDMLRTQIRPLIESKAPNMAVEAMHKLMDKYPRLRLGMGTDEDIANTVLRLINRGKTSPGEGMTKEEKNQADSRRSYGLRQEQAIREQFSKDVTSSDRRIARALRYAAQLLQEIDL